VERPIYLHTVQCYGPVASVSKRHINNIQQREGRGRTKGSDILGRTLRSHQTNPRFPSSALHLGAVAHSLLCLLGSTQTRENVDVLHWGSYNPCEGRALEWRLRMYGVYHHSTWLLAHPPCSLMKSLNDPLLTLEETFKVCQ